MSKDDHIPFTTLLDWLEGKLSEKEADAVAAQLETADTTTQSNRVWLKRFQQLSRELQLERPPEQVRRALRDQFVAGIQKEPSPSFFHRLLATLTFDSSRQPAGAGLRSAAAGQERQLVYTTDAVEIAVNVQPHARDEQFDLYGQIFPLEDDPDTAFAVQLLRNDQEISVSASDELGEFSFANLAAGNYTLVLAGEQTEIEISPIELAS